MGREDIAGMINSFFTRFLRKMISNRSTHGADNSYSNYRHHGNITEKKIKFKLKNEKST